MPDSHLPPARAVEAAAAQWLARRDRGLSASEEAEYAGWLAGDVCHRAAIERLERTWLALDRLAVPDAGHARVPDPDRLAPSGRQRRALWIGLPLIAAAAAVVAFVSFRPIPPSPAGSRPAILHPGPRHLDLDDGTVVELKADAQVDVAFTRAERRVRLVRGEAFFTVAKSPLRPFIVSVNQVEVRAVGTAFSVGLAIREISVLVTEGRVRVDESSPPAAGQPPVPHALSALGAGQQGVMAVEDRAAGTMTVTQLSPSQLDRALAWRGMRLEFAGLPLGEVVREFNRYNEKQLVVHDAATAAIRVGGNFRADNVDAFVRLLDAGFGVSAFPVGGEIILRKTHAP